VRNNGKHTVIKDEVRRTVLYANDHSYSASPQLYIKPSSERPIRLNSTQLNSTESSQKRSEPVGAL